VAEKRAAHDMSDAARDVRGRWSLPMMHLRPHPKGLVLLPLRWSDWEFCRALANEPTVRAASFDPAPPTARSHRRWMSRHLLSAQARAWVGWWRGHQERVAVVTLHGTTAWLEVGVAVHPDARGQGVATSCIRQVCGEAIRWYGTDALLVARIREDNVASRAVFAKAHFEPATHDTARGLVEMTWQL
jgi:RimJ/RimL family protein N-acetyltransferase